MDSELYDELGNYIGPELESDKSDEGEEQEKDDLQLEDDKQTAEVMEDEPVEGSMAVVLHETHPELVLKEDRSLRYTDTLFTEQEHGVSFKSSPLSLVMSDSKEKSYLLNVFDTPGHVNFSDEVTVAYKLTDGVVIFVDASDGLMMNTEDSSNMLSKRSSA